MLVRGVLFGLIAVSLAGCSLIRPFGGEGVSAVALPYSASISKGDDVRDLTVTVKANGASLEDVRESARFPVTRYCLTNYGGSDADWSLDPATGDWAFERDGEDMILTARCTTR